MHKKSKPKKERTAKEKSKSALKAVEKRRKNNPKWGKKKRLQESEMTKKNVNAGKKGKKTRQNTGGHTTKTQDTKRQVMLHYSKKLSKSKIPCCNCCGEKTSLDFLCIDHISGRRLGNGKKDTRRGSSLYSYLISNNYPRGYQVLCWNCNSTKFVYLICPHKRKKR